METPTAKLFFLVGLLLHASLVFAQNEVEKSYLIPLGNSGNLNQLIDLSSGSNSSSPLQTDTIGVVLNFDGIIESETANEIIPSATGDVNDEYYIQVANGGAGSVFKIFDKHDGSLVAGPSSMNLLWASTGQTGFGSPIVLWDQGANRWLLAEMGLFGTNSILVAISKTENPLGDWHLYQFDAPNYADAPKIGNHPSGYILTTVETSDQDVVPVYMLEREAMIEGSELVQVQRIGLPKFQTSNGSIYQNASPVDWDGAASPPPFESPAYVMRMYDDAWNGGLDHLEIWEIIVDWNNSDFTIVNGPIDLVTEPFDADVCEGSFYNCLEEGDGSNVAAMMQILMHRVNYRNFGAFESIVLNHVVDADGNNTAGIKWYELRKYTNGDWLIHQEGLLDGQDKHRFIGSIAIDAGGNIGIGYSIMGANQHLSLAFAGRRFFDPPGQLNVSEQSLVEGESYNDNFRWGDYSMMSVDETDGQSFWFSGPYMKAEQAWGSRITSFVLHKDSIDIGVDKLAAPLTSAYLTDQETVEVRVRNFGYNTQTNFEIGLILDDNFIASQVVYETLEPDSTIQVVFDTPVDLALVGPHEFKIYTILQADQNVLNDTLRATVIQLPRYDAGIVDIILENELLCDNYATAGLVIKNFGADTLSELNIDWFANAQNSQTYEWMGALAPDGMDTVFVTVNDLINGSNSIQANTQLPDGLIDEDPDNDFMNRDFEVITEGEVISLNLNTDNFPTETTWRLEDNAGQIIYQGGPYFVIDSLFIENMCLLEGCYTLRVFDAFGNGMSSGNGFYQVLDEEEHILGRMEDADFGDEDVRTFCTPFECSLTGEITATLESSIGAYDASISITQSNGMSPFQYSIDGGQNFYPSPTFTGLSGNTYEVLIMDANGCLYEQEIEVHTCTVQFSVVTTNATQNMDNGSISINPAYGVPPYQFSIDNGQSFQDSSFFDYLVPATYVVIVMDSLGCTFTMETEINFMTGTADDFYNEKIIIQPNPTKGMATLKIESQFIIEKAELLNTIGVLIQEIQLNIEPDGTFGLINLSAQAKGVYLVRLKTAHGDIVRRVVRR